MRIQFIMNLDASFTVVTNAVMSVSQTLCTKSSEWFYIKAV